jgi:hypothetical protein
MAEAMPIVNWRSGRLLRCIILQAPVTLPKPLDMRRSATIDCLLCPRWTPIKYKDENNLLGNAMKVFIAALLFAGIAAVGTSMILNAFQEPGYVAFTTSGARVGDPGRNLVGPG